jgi:hypothetical protein
MWLVTCPPPIFWVVQQPYSGLGRLFAEVSRSHTDTPHPAGLLWTRDRPVVETSTWQHTTFTADSPPCPPAGFESAVRARARPQTYEWDRAVTGVGGFVLRVSKCLTLMQCSVWTFTVMCVIQINFHFLTRCITVHHFITIQRGDTKGQGEFIMYRVVWDTSPSRIWR